MKKRMLQIGEATVHSSGNMFAVFYMSETTDRRGTKEVVISFYNEDDEVWETVVHRIPYATPDMIFSITSADLLLIVNTTNDDDEATVNVVTFTRSSGYRDKKEVNGAVKIRKEWPIVFRAEHKGVIYLSDECSDSKREGNIIFAMETATGKIIPAITLDPIICYEKIVILNDSLMAVISQRCGDEPDRRFYYRTYRPETLRLYGASMSKK